MKIEEMNNNQFIKHYSSLLLEIENLYSTKKEYETEFKKRFRNGGFDTMDYLENDSITFKGYEQIMNEEAKD